MTELQPDFSKQTGEQETWRVGNEQQELVESTEVGPDGKKYIVKRIRNSTGGFSETKKLINIKTLEHESSVEIPPNDPPIYNDDYFKKEPKNSNEMSPEEIADEYAIKHDIKHNKNTK
ncbi:MAG: hypothetical protein WCP14_00630 [bacterium]